jgi:hypothetical protein
MKRSGANKNVLCELRKTVFAEVEPCGRITTLTEGEDRG